MAFLEGNSNHIIEFDHNPADSHLSDNEMNKSHILSFSGSGHNHPSPLPPLSSSGHYSEINSEPLPLLLMCLSFLDPFKPLLGYSSFPTSSSILYTLPS